MKKTVGFLTLIYYSFYILAVAVAGCGFYILKMDGIKIDPLSQTGIALSSALIIFIIGSIPLALGLFHRQTKKWKNITDEDEKFKTYRKGAAIRLAVIGVGMLLGILFFYLMSSQSMIFCAGIAAIGLFFCKPTENKIASDLDVFDE